MINRDFDKRIQRIHHLQALRDDLWAKAFATVKDADREALAKQALIISNQADNAITNLIKDTGCGR